MGDTRPPRARATTKKRGLSHTADMRRYWAHRTRRPASPLIGSICPMGDTRRPRARATTKKRSLSHTADMRRFWAHRTRRPASPVIGSKKAPSRLGGVGPPKYHQDVLRLAIIVLLVGGCGSDEASTALSKRVAALESANKELSARVSKLESPPVDQLEPEARSALELRRRRAEAAAERRQVLAERRRAQQDAGAANGEVARDNRANFETYQRLYRAVGNELDNAGLPPGHALVESYLDINYQSGIMNATLRTKYIKRLKGIRYKVRKLSK